MVDNQSGDSIAVYEYTDHRKYISDKLDELKRTAGISRRKFAERCGFGSHSFLKKIIDGESDMTEQTTRKLARGFDLDDSQADFFDTLVKFAQAEHLNDKNYFYRKLMADRPARNAQTIDEGHFILFSEWYNVAIRELVADPEFKEDPEWIGAKLEPAVDPENVQKGIDLLLRLGYLARNDAGHLFQTEPQITTGPEVGSLAVKNYHHSMIDLAGQALDNTQSYWRDISSLCILIDREEFFFIKNEVIEFRKKILRYLEDRKEHGFDEQVTGSDKTLYQMNFQLFNSTAIPWKKPKGKK